METEKTVEVEIKAENRPEALKPKFSSSFLTRIKSALIMAVIICAVVVTGDFFFTLAMAACAAYAVYEWSNMTLSNKTVHEKLQPMAMAFAGAIVVISGLVDNPAMTLWILFAFCFFILSFNVSKEGPNITKFIFGIAYICFSLNVMVWLRNVSPNGLYNVVTLLFIVWASDTFAYISGKSIGGPKLAPTISPNKTWAGFIGSSVGAGIITALLATPPVLAIFSATTLGGLGWVGYMVIGAILAMFGQAGDLLVSLLKRHYDVKDTGNLIPGHGGLLDRIDALILVTMVFGSLAIILG